MSNAIWVTGIGAVGPLGLGQAALARAVEHPRPHFQPTPPAWAAMPGCPPAFIAPLPADAETAVASWLNAATDRVTALGHVAAGEAWAQASSPAAGARGAVFWGTALGGASTHETSYERLFAQHLPLRPTTVVRIMANATAAQLATRFGLHGAAVTCASACASGAVAIAEACWALRAGRADVVLAGGSDAMLAPGILSAWAGLLVLTTQKAISDPNQACRPFAAKRTGMVLGEGAAALVLETERHARARGARPLAVLSGWAQTSDATASLVHPVVSWQATAMREALALAGVRPEQVDAVNAHATGTTAGDVAEAKALAEVMGRHRPLTHSTKALHGHLLGAAGAYEAAMAITSLQLGCIPGQPGTGPIDPDCAALDVPEQAQHRPMQHVLSNSFAFGGHNVSLVISQPPAA